VGAGERDMTYQEAVAVLIQTLLLTGSEINKTMEAIAVVARDHPKLTQSVCEREKIQSVCEKKGTDE